MTIRIPVVLAFVSLCVAGCLHAPPAPLSAEASADRLDERSPSSADVREVLALWRGEPVEAWPPEVWSLDALLAAAIVHHPMLAIARSDRALSEAHRRAVAQLRNPTLQIQPTRVAGPTSAVSPWIASIRPTFYFETAGKRRRRIAAAEARARGSASTLERDLWLVREAVFRAALSTRACERRRLVRERLEAFQHELLDQLEQKRVTGAVSAGEVDQARAAVAQAAADRVAAQRLEVEARVALATALGVPLASLEHLVLDPAIDAVGEAVRGLDASALRRAGLTGRPDVLASLAEYDATEEELRLELAKQYPDVQLGPGYEYDQGTDRWSLQLTIGLPILSQNRGGIAEAIAARARAAARFEAVQLTVLEEIDAAAATFRSSRDERTRLEERLATANAQLVRARDARAAGALARAAVVAKEIEVGQAQLAYLDAVERNGLAFVRLEQAVEPREASGKLFEMGTLR
ncbi:MAG: TolC family protein [Myxococcota bacterium]